MEARQKLAFDRAGVLVSDTLARAKPMVRWSLRHGMPRAMLWHGARRGDLQGRIMVESEHGRDISGLFGEVRAVGPIAPTRFGWITASQPVVREVLSSNDFRTGTFDPDDSALGRLAAWSASELLDPIQPPSLLATDPPDHTRYRKLVTRVFTARAIERLRARIQQISEELLDEIGAADRGEPVDLIESYCALLPVTVISEILGVPPHERDRVLAFGAATAPAVEFGLHWRVFRSVETAQAEFSAWLGDHFERLRRHPGDNLLSHLVAVRDDGVGLTERELKATAGLVLTAGFETTVNLLGSGIALLAGHPRQLALVRECPELWSNAVEEVLRYDPPILQTGRTALRDTDVSGVPLPRGAFVATLLAGANRDPQVFANADVFDVTRSNAREHVSFGAGRHHCLGASLARLEGEIGLRAIFDRFPALRVLPGANGVGPRSCADTSTCRACSAERMCGGCLRGHGRR
ncbi:MAG TPA: cytochrome P450 [Pseudonocardiaceae bacterium]|nr:cytochrome P450 [Pseudonocardiaceae bacterium]